MLFYSNAKINLGLYILNKRADGYHNIQSVLYPIPFHDFIDVIITDKFSYTNTGIQVNCPIEKNLCFRAYQILQHKLPSNCSISIHHHKMVPAQMGLGGGSANASTVLIALNKLFKLHLSTQQLKHYAALLGNDCTFFIDNIPSLATQTGSQIQPISINLEGYYLVLYLPSDIAINTQWAYTHIEPNPIVDHLEKTIQSPINQWKYLLKNDFEQIVFQTHPRLKDVKDNFYSYGALYSALSGSGACVYGIFDSNTYKANSFDATNYWSVLL